MNKFIPSNRKSVTIFSTEWCGYCVNLKMQLKNENIAYSNIDIEDNKSANKYLLNLTKGQQTVPTVVFYDNSYIVNPSINEVKDKLKYINSSKI